MKVKRSQITVTVVLFLIGFTLALAYQTANEASSSETINDSPWQAEEDLQNEVLEEQQENRQLADEISGVQSEIQQYEEDIAEQEEQYFNQVEDIERLRMVTGNVSVEGEGVEIRLDDSEYVHGEDDPNQFIVHEHHIQEVVDELYAAGAEAVAINGQRLAKDSYIYCVGPVVEVDTYTSFAPFEITAIGDQDTLEESLNMNGGVKDQLVNENVQVRTEKLDNLQINAIHEDGGDAS